MTYRTENNGALRKVHVNNEVTLCGWVQRTRDFGGMTFVDLRDRYGITQLVFNMNSDQKLCDEARKLGREFVIQVEGLVRNRASVNKNLITGEIEVEVKKLIVLNSSKTPPFTIEDETDGGEDLRMRYRYLDLRRRVVQDNIMLRSEKLFEYLLYINANSCERIIVRIILIIKSFSDT